MEISGQKETRSQDYALLLIRMILRVLYSAQYHREHYTQAMSLNSLEHFMYTTQMTNIRHNRYANLAPPGYNSQSIRAGHIGAGHI